MGRIGQIPWNKGLRTGLAPWRGKKRPHLAKTGAAKTMFKKGQAPWNKGKKGYSLHSDEYKRKKREMWLGENNPRWKGGIWPEHQRLRWSVEHKEWAREVKKRDGYTCQICGKIGGKLHSDHIKPFSEYPKLRFDLNNGRTLCVECHRKLQVFWGNQYSPKGGDAHEPKTS